MNRPQATGSRGSFRQSDPIDSLNRTIADLEARIERLNTGNRQPRRAQAENPDNAGWRSSPGVRPASRPTAADRTHIRPDPQGSRSMERGDRYNRDDWHHSASPAAMREVVADAHDLSETIQTLRHDLRDDMSETFDRRIGALRHDIGDVNALHAELDELRAIVRQLPDEKSIRRLEDRWDGFEDRLSGLDATALREELVTLSHRLDDIKASIGQLPSHLPMHALEDKIKMLVGAIDAICRQTGSKDPELIHRFAILDERLDEISRAIVAAGMSRYGDTDSHAINALDARFDTLLDQLDTIGQALPPLDLAERLGAMSDRIDELSNERAHAELIDRLDTLSHYIVEGSTATDPRLLDQIDRIALKVDGIDIGNGGKGLSEQLEALSARIDSFAGELSAANSNQDMLYGRLEDMAGQMRQLTSHNGPADLSHIETGLANIAARLDETAVPQIAGDDAILSLEQQVSDLSRFLSQPVAPADPELVPRLAAIEEQLSASQSDREEMIVEAARKAAEAAVATLQRDNASVTDISAIESLVADLRSLEENSRRSDERNARTTDAVHDTLVKIAERLEDLDSPDRFALAATRVEPPLFTDAEDSPADSDGEPADETSYPVFARQDDGELPMSAPTDTDVLAQATENAPHDRDDAPSIDPAEQMDSETANRPLEPGSGAPDIANIMAKVREAQRRSLDGDGNDEGTEDVRANRSDIIAAARRAARAAASEAAIEVDRDRLSDATDHKTGGKSEPTRKRVRKSILMATGAVLLAVLAYPFVMDFLDDDGSKRVATLEGPAVVEPADTPSAVVEAPEVTAGAAPLDPKARDDAGGANLPASPETTGAVSIEPPDDIPPGLSPENSIQPSDEFYADDTQPSLDVTPPAAPGPDVQPIATPSEAVGPAALREAALQGDSLALFEIGARYTDGRGVAVDMQEAAKWYEFSANLGFAPAQYRLANLYEKGTGVERDLGKAQTWYQMAAEQGNASAMHNLAVLFAMKREGVSDFESAALWFKRAADFGVKDSQFNLAILFARGNGVPQDLVESYKWFAIVATSGDNDAAKKRDEVGNALRPEQLQEARERVEQWKPAELDGAANSIQIPENWSGPESAFDMNKAVLNIQAILTKNGFDTGGVDGIMGDRTISAIKQFQASIGQEPTGEVTGRLVEELLARNS